VGFTAILGRLISLPAFDLVWWRMFIVVAAVAVLPPFWESGPCAGRTRRRDSRASGSSSHCIG
jgi:hypothetical protein